jgi:hypothetical protein
MGKKDNEPKPAPEADLDLTEGLPADDAGQEGGDYVPAVRRSMSLQAPGQPQLMDMEGVTPPYLSLVHGTSKELLKAGFNAGDLVLKKAYCVAPRGRTLQAIILRWDDYQKERLSKEQWDAQVRPRTFKTREEAIAAGLNGVWDDAKGLKPEFSPATDYLLLIKRNEGVSDALFGLDLGIEMDGQPTDWGFAIMSLDKGTQKTFKSDIAMTINGRLRPLGCYAGLWDLSTDLAPQSRNSANQPFVIRAKFRGVLDPVVVDNIRNAMSVPVSVKEDAGEDFP